MIVSPKIFIVLAIPLVLLGYLVGHYLPKQIDKSYDRDKVAKITSFLDQIKFNFTEDIKKIQADTKALSWGCGPSSYAMGEIINKRFFDNQLTIDTFYDNEPYEIVQRFGFAQFDQNGQKIIGDHAWLEVFVGDEIIFIDPTIAQYGNVNGMVYEVFKVGDPGIRDTLKDKYSIIDSRLSILIRKVANKIPASEPPYPGLSIDPNDLEYYYGLLQIRNTVSIGREPESWKGWVDTLLAKY